MQIHTIAELLGGKRVDMPPQNTTLKRAERAATLSTATPLSRTDELEPVPVPAGEARVDDDLDDDLDDLDEEDA